MLKYVKKKNILGFQYNEPNYTFNQNYKYQIYIERNFTKKILLNHLKIQNNENVLNSPQFWSGTIFFKNNEFSLNFLYRWEELSAKSELIDDSLLDEKKGSKFVEHRHDQSIFSLLCKINNIEGLSASECEWAETKNKRTWDHLKNFPVLAKRDKKYNILKRFFNRQKKNILRFLNKLK